MSMKNIAMHSCAASLLLGATLATALPTNGTDCAQPTAPACFVTSVFTSGSATNAAIGGGSSGFDTDAVTANNISDDSTTSSEQTTNADGSITTKVTSINEDGSTDITVIVTQPSTSNADGSSSISQRTTTSDGSVENTTVLNIRNADGSATRVTSTVFGDGTIQQISVTAGADGKFQSGDIEFDVPNDDGTVMRTEVHKDRSGTVLRSNIVLNSDGSDAAGYASTFMTYSHGGDGSTTLETNTIFSNGEDLQNTVTSLSDGTSVVFDHYTGMNKGASYTSRVDQETYVDGSYLTQIERDANDPVNLSGSPFNEYSGYGVQLPTCTSSDCWGKWNWANWNAIPAVWLSGLEPGIGDIPAYIFFDYQTNGAGAITTTTGLEVDYVPDDPTHYNLTTLQRMAAAWKNSDWTYQVVPGEDRYIIVGRRTH